MKKSLVLLIALVLMVSAPAVFAGKGHHKCNAPTQECLDKMVAKLKHKGMIGVEGEWDESIPGYKIATFLEGSNAKAAGIKPGDILVAVNGIKLGDKKASKADYENRKPGKVAKITVLRGDAKKSFKVKLMGLNETQIAQMIGEHMLDHATTKIAKAD